MNYGKALAVACDVEREYGDHSIAFLDRQIEISLENANEEDVTVWRRVREMLVQLHSIAFFSYQRNC